MIEVMDERKENNYMEMRVGKKEEMRGIDVGEI